jgi:hypothetical protein
VYAATVNGRPRTFEVAGVWRRNMLMRDRETGSIWQQATGEAVAGPEKGGRLEPLGADQTTWAAWRAEHPHTKVAVDRPEDRRGLVYRLPYREIIDRFGRMRWVTPGLGGVDRRLPSREDVVGISLGGEARAYSLATLRAHRLVHDEIGGIPLAMVHESGGDLVRVLRRQVGREAVDLVEEGRDLVDVGGGRRWDRRGAPLAGTSDALARVPFTRERWLAWSEFHPSSSIFAPRPRETNGA